MAPESTGASRRVPDLPRAPVSVSSVESSGTSISGLRTTAVVSGLPSVRGRSGGDSQDAATELERGVVEVPCILCARTRPRAASGSVDSGATGSQRARSPERRAADRNATLGISGCLRHGRACPAGAAWPGPAQVRLRAQKHDRAASRTRCRLGSRARARSPRSAPRAWPCRRSPRPAASSIGVERENYRAGVDGAAIADAPGGQHERQLQLAHPVAERLATAPEAQADAPQRAFDAFHISQIPRQAAKCAAPERRAASARVGVGAAVSRSRRPENSAPSIVALHGARRPRASARNASFASRTVTGNPSQRSTLRSTSRSAGRRSRRATCLPRRRTAGRAESTAAAAAPSRGAGRTRRSSMRRSAADGHLRGTARAAQRTRTRRSLPCSWLTSTASVLATTVPLNAAAPACGHPAPSKLPTRVRSSAPAPRWNRASTLACVESAVRLQPRTGRLEVQRERPRLGSVLQQPQGAAIDPAAGTEPRRPPGRAVSAAAACSSLPCRTVRPVRASVASPRPHRDTELPAACSLISPTSNAARGDSTFALERAKLQLPRPSAARSSHTPMSLASTLRSRRRPRSASSSSTATDPGLADRHELLCAESRRVQDPHAADSQDQLATERQLKRTLQCDRPSRAADARCAAASRQRAPSMDTPATKAAIAAPRGKQTSVATTIARRRQGLVKADTRYIEARRAQRSFAISITRPAPEGAAA